MALRPLNVRITGDTTQFDTAMGRARRGLRSLSIAAGAAAGAVVGGLTAMTVAGLRASDQLAKTARSMDATANGLRAVQIAAGYAGVSVEEANTSLQQLNRELYRAREAGTPAAEALERLGLSVEDLESLDADARMARIADRVQELGLSAGETSDVLRDLGVRSRNMALLFAQGGSAIRSARDEVRDFGLELSDSQLAAIESANDAVSRMSLVFESLRNRLAVEVAPVMQTVADRFNDFAQSDAAQDAVRRLSEAFGELANILSSEDFLLAATSAFEGLANLSTGLANGLVTVTQNVELLTTAAAGAAVALAAMGGPITLIVGTAAAAAAGIYTIANRSDDLSDASQAAADAQDALNSALGDFSPVGREANGVSVDRAHALQDQAEAALAAAEAELELARAELESQTIRGGAGGAMAGAMDPDARRQAIDDFETATSRVDELHQSLENVRRTVQGLTIGEAGGAFPLSGVEFDSEDDEDSEDAPPSVPGLPGGGAVANQLQGRLEALLEGLATEREVLEQWYQEGQETLEQARERQLITEQEYQERRLRLEEEYARRSNNIERMRSDTNFQIVSGGINEILGAAAQGNDRIMRVQRAFAAGMAWIDTLQGAARELRRGTFGFATAAAVIAKGIGFVSAINNTNGSSRGAINGGGGGGTSASATAEARPVQRIVIDAPEYMQGSLDQLVGQLTEANRQGYDLDAIVRGR